jgi:hypothetical protein
MASTIERPVTAPYTSQVHQATWAAWDAYVEKCVKEGIHPSHLESYIVRKSFMDGFIEGLKA